MLFFRRLLLLLSPRHRRRRDLELDEELRANLALAADEAAESGLTPDQAAPAARREIGNLTRVREEARAVWFPGWDDLAQDVRYAARSLRRAPVFTLVAILSLALGIGSATALFSLVDWVVLRPLSYRDPGRLVYVREIVPPLAHLYPTIPVNIRHFLFWRDDARSFSSIVAMVSSGGTITTGEPETIEGAAVTAGFCEILGVEPQLGRCFSRDEEQRGRSKVALIADSLWRRRFGAAPDVAGRPLVVDGVPHTVIGVLPASFRFPKRDDLGSLSRLGARTEIFRPIDDAGGGWGGDYDYIVLGRLRSGVSREKAAAELNVLERRIMADQHLGYTPGAQVDMLQDVVVSPVRTALGVLLAAVMLLLLIVCVNLANLLLARGSARAREFALRVALGARRGRLMVHALMETLLLALAGGALGAFGARAAVRLFTSSARVNLPRLDEVQVDGRVWLFAFGLSLACGVLFGLLPSLRLARLDPQQTLRSGSYTQTVTRGGLRVREWLVGGEVALSAMLLVLAGLLINSLAHVLRVDKGFHEEQTVLVHISLPGQYRSPQQRNGFFDLAVERFRTLPGVRSAAFISKPPLTGESNVNEVSVEGAAGAALDPVTRQTLIVNVRFIGPDYFSTLGIPLLKGRALEEADRQRSVAVLSARLAAKIWPNENPLGRKITSASGVSGAEVVGVVGDVHSSRLEQDPTMMVYAPFWKRGFDAGYVAIRTAGGVPDLLAQVRGALRTIDPGLSAPELQTAGALVTAATAQRRFQMDVAAAFAGSALLLALLGIYGVVAYGVSLRRREMGVRLALGAGPGDVRRLVLRQGLRPVVAGLGIGLAVALAAGRLVRTMLFGISPADAPTLVAVAAVLACVGAAACVLPACRRRASIRRGCCGMNRAPVTLLGEDYGTHRIHYARPGHARGRVSAS